MRTAAIPFAVVLLALHLAVPFARAQEAPVDTVRAIPIAPVVVTVLRTPMEIGRTPFAVSVNDEAKIQRAQPGLGLDEALRGIPGVQVDNRFNFAVGERIAIRGFGARAQFGVRGVRVFVDGIPATLPDGQTALSHVDLATVRRAEVIRGPASALYGNTAGGVVQLETALPPAVPLGQELRAVAGSNGLLRLGSSTGGTLGGTSYLLNLSRLEYGGYRDFSAGRNLFAGGRLATTRGRDALRLTFSAVDSDAQNPGSLSEALLREDRSQAFANNKAQQTGKQAREAQIGATWTRAAGLVELETTGYLIRRDVVNPIPTVIIALDRGAQGLRSLLRGGSARGVEWAIGAEVDRQRDDRRNYANVRGERGPLGLDQLEHVTNAAGYAQLTTTPLAALTLLGGVRYDWFRFQVEDRFVTATNPDDSGERRMSAASPSLGASLVLSDAVNLYANFATSFETPTTTELANRPEGAGGFNPELRPQHARSVEAGFRGRVGAYASYQLSAYRASVRNSLIAFEVPEAAGRQFFRNAGSAIHRGVEAGLTFAPHQALRLDGAYTHVDARFREYATRAGSFAGNRVPGVAPHRLELSVTAMPAHRWYAVVDWRHLSSIAADDANTAFSPAHSLLDVRLGREAPGGLRGRGFAPFAGISNVFDTEHNAAVAVNAFGGRFYEPGPGRSVFAGFTLRI